MPLMFAAESSSSGGAMMYLPILLLALVFVLMVLSQRRRAKATSLAQGSLTVGDEVRTTSGLYGTLRELDEQSGFLEIADGVVVRFDRRAILPGDAVKPTPQSSSSGASRGSHPAVPTSNDPVSSEGESR